MKNKSFLFVILVVLTLCLVVGCSEVAEEGDVLNSSDDSIEPVVDEIVDSELSDDEFIDIGEMV